MGRGTRGMTGAGIGAAMGSGFGATGMLVGAGLGGMIGGGADAAQAAEGAARAQADATRRAYNYARGLESRVNELAALTPQEIHAYEANIQAGEKLVTNDMKLLDAIDPAIMEASQQALKLLRGEDAASIAPMRAQRDLQRKQLLNSLRQQLGPGAETSTAGIKALNDFDMQTSSMMSGVQQSALGMMLGTAQTQRGQTGGNMGAFQNASTNYRNARGTVANFALEAGNSVLGALGAQVQTAGSPFVGQMVGGQQASAFSNQLLGIGGMMMGAGKGMSWGGGGGVNSPQLPHPVGPQ